MRFSLGFPSVFVRAVLHQEFVRPKSDKLLERASRGKHTVNHRACDGVQKLRIVSEVAGVVAFPGSSPATRSPALPTEH